MPLPDNPSFSIVVPVYNEESAIRQTITELIQIGDQTEMEYEIILVNDGSQDRTRELLDQAELPGHIQVIHHHRNRGYGASLKTGIKASKHPVVVITDADGTYPIGRIAEFVTMFAKRQLDMLVGARIGDNVHIPQNRLFAKKLLNLLANYLAGVKIPDLNSGFRVMRKSVVERFMNILPDTFSFTTTISLAMLTNGYAVEYEPINYQHRQGSSKIRPIQDTFLFFCLIWRTVIFFRPMKVFFPVSAFIIIFGLCLWAYRLLVGEAFSVTSTILILGGIQIFGLGLVADILARK